MKTANILYLIITYNPLDNNQHYFRSDGYIYNNIRLVNQIKNTSKHNIDIVVSGFLIGNKTIECMKHFRDREKIDFKCVVGPDASSHIGTNKTLLEVCRNKDYDYVWLSTSDTLPCASLIDKLDTVIQDFHDDEKCNFLYVPSYPNFFMPNRKKRDQIPLSYYECVPMGDAFNQDVHVVKKQWLDNLSGKSIMDIFEGATTEFFVGFISHSQGGFRKIAKLVQYDHVGRIGKFNTDRKISHTNKVRGGSHFASSAFLKRDIYEIVDHANKIHPVLDFSVTCGSLPGGFPVSDVCMDKYNQPSEKKCRLMYEFVRNELFLTEEELDYDSIKVEMF